ncbi:MAG: hypothetical protein RQM92_04755 [Candidatus Syntrophopropionicum ammoniitolerans]
MNKKIFQQILEKLDKIESRVNNIESTQQEQTQLLHALEYRTDVTNAAVTTIDETLQRTEGKIASMEGKITSMEGKITSMEGKITSMEGRIASLEKTTLSIGEYAEHNRKETIDKLETLDSSVMYLANRLTQHDMQLFDMKRGVK